MIKCSFCHASNIDNTLFCTECGNYLVDEEQMGTDPLDVQSEVKTEETEETDQHPSEWEPIEHTLIHFDIEAGQKELELQLNKPIYFGRLDPILDNFPEVDLTEMDGLDKGVSRRHAKITKQDGMLVIEDLGSVNGTFVNGHKLPPYSTEAIHSGDVIQLGQLTIKINLL